MEYKTYLARKRLKKLVICGHVNIPYGTAVTNEGGVLMWNGKPVCATTSQDAFDFFSQNDDGRGRERGELVSATKGAIIHHPKVGALRSPKAPRRRAVIFRSHGLLQIIQGTLRFPCAGCRQLPFCGLAIWGHLAL